jgi:hypothetical protein
VKTLVTRIIPLLVCVAAGSVLSWVSIYSFWFAIWIFHSVPAARFCDAIGSALLFPGRQVFGLLGGDQNVIFFDPIPFSGTNGLILGIVFYSVFRAVLKGWEARKQVNGKPQEPNRVEAKAG